MTTEFLSCIGVALPLVGVVVGASLQYFFTRYLEDVRHRRNLRTESYMDYIKCVCEHANLRAHLKAPEMAELLSRTANAKARICLYGSAKAIRRFAIFERLGASMNTEDQRQVFIEMVSAMREDSGGESGAGVKDLEIVLLGNHKVAS